MHEFANGSGGLECAVRRGLRRGEHTRSGEPEVRPVIERVAPNDAEEKVRKLGQSVL
jgi:hypothetical protein